MWSFGECRSRIQRKADVVVYPGSTGYSIISGMQIAPRNGAGGTPPNGTTILFFDDFNGPNLNPIWQASLPSAHIG